MPWPSGDLMDDVTVSGDAAMDIAMALISCSRRSRSSRSICDPWKERPANAAACCANGSPNKCGGGGGGAWCGCPGRSSLAILASLAWAAEMAAFMASCSRSAVAFRSRSSRFRASLESGTGLKKRSVLAQEFPSPRFQFLVKMADCDRWHSVLSGFGGGEGSRGVGGGDGLDLQQDEAYQSLLCLIAIMRNKLLKS